LPPRTDEPRQPGRAVPVGDGAPGDPAHRLEESYRLSPPADRRSQSPTARYHARPEGPGLAANGVPRSGAAPDGRVLQGTRRKRPRQVAALDLPRDHEKMRSERGHSLDGTPRRMGEEAEKADELGDRRRAVDPDPISWERRADLRGRHGTGVP